MSSWLSSTFVAARRLHVWHHGVGSSWCRYLELIRRWSSSCPIFLVFCEGVRHLPHDCQFPNKNYNMGIVSWKRFRKARRSRYCPCRWSTSSTLRWTCWSSSSYSRHAGKTPCSGDSRTAESTCLTVSLRFVSCCWTVECGMPGIPCNQRCRHKFLRNFFTMRFGGEDFLASWSVWSCCPLCEFGFCVTRGNRGDWSTLWHSSSSVINANRFLK